MSVCKESRNLTSLTVMDLHTEFASVVHISLAKLSGCTIGLDNVIIIITIIGLMTKLIQVVITWSHPELLSDSICLVGYYNHVFLWVKLQNK